MTATSLLPSGLTLNWLRISGIKKLDKPGATTSIYAPWSYAPYGATSSFNYVQGIGPGTFKGTYTIVGTYGQFDDGAIGVVYQGGISGTSTTQGSGPGTWTTMVLPKTFKSLGTSIYGVHNKGRGQFDLVGTYVSKAKTTDIGGKTLNNTLGFYYTGKITSAPKASRFKSFQARDPVTGQLADETYLHSTSGGLIAGNYDFFGEGRGYGNAIVVNIKTGAQTNLRYDDDALSHSVYGIWSNGGSSYTVAGGATNVRGSLKPGINDGPTIGDGTLADYDSVTGEVSNLRTYRYPGSGGSSKETHFEGIWSNGDGLYKLPFMSFNGNGQPSGSGVAIVHRLKNGTFSDARWITFNNPAGVTLFSNDSVWDQASIGAQISSSNPKELSTYAALTHSI